MALRINQEIQTRDGFTVPSGTIVKFSTTFPALDMRVDCNMNFYKDETMITGGTKYFPSELPNMGYSKTLTIEEFTGLTTTTVNTYIKDYLELTYTAGTIDIIL